MSRMTMSTGSIRGLVANLFAADKTAQRVIRQTVRKYGRKQHQLTRELAPVDTGFLRDHVRVRFSEDGLAYQVGFEEKDFAAEGLAFYPLFTEFGTRFMAARPCVFPARDRIAPEFRSALGANVRGALRRQRGRAGR